MHVITTRWDWNRWVAAGATAFIGVLGWSDIARADAVTDWHQIATDTLCSGPTTPPRFGPPSGIVDLAIVQIAVHDAVQSIGGKYKPYVGAIPDAKGSPEAAAAKAAHDVLASFYGPKSTELGTIYKAYLTSKGLKEDDPGVAVGAKAAAAAIANRADDGRIVAAAPTSFVGATGTGAWRPTDPHKEMAGPHTGKFKGFVIKDGTQFRPGPPPDLKSEQYAKDYNEVKAVGAKENSTRTPEQTELADFYRSDYLCRTFQQVPQNVVKAHSKSLDDSARAMALAQIAAADTLITAWESKVHYNFWRPITAIHNGENDGNPATAGDPNWVPYLVTPPYSDYLSGANSLGGAYHRALALAFGKDDLPFTITTTAPEAKQKTRNYAKLTDWATDIVNVRIYQGLHFRTADQTTREVGEKIADLVFKEVGTPK